MTLNIIEGYPQPIHQVAREYTDPSTTPLKETVKPGKNHFDFEVEKPKKKRRRPRRRRKPGPTDHTESAKNMEETPVAAEPA